jgi:hypothetical protein
MTASAEPSFEQLMAALTALSTTLSGRDGDAIREYVQRLAVLLAADGHEDELRARTADALEQLIAALGPLFGVRRGPDAAAIRGVDLRQLVDGLRDFVAYLRAPTDANQGRIEQLVGKLQQAPVLQPVPLDELQIDGAVEQLAVEAARRHGLVGAEVQQAVERMTQQVSSLVQQLELRARQEASRATTAMEFERLIDAVVQTGSELGQAIASVRAQIVQAYRRVDLAHMAEGLGAFAEWLSTPADDATVHVAELRVALAEVLGPPTAGDPARSQAERRADFEREIQVAIDQIFREANPS